MSLVVLKFVLSFHLDLGTFELHIQLSKLVLSSHLVLVFTKCTFSSLNLSWVLDHLGSGKSKLHAQIPKVIKLYHCTVTVHLPLRHLPCHATHAGLTHVVK